MLTTHNSKLVGTFTNNKPDGKCVNQSYGFEYNGSYSEGLKAGFGKEDNKLDHYIYEGSYEKDQYDGEGCFTMNRKEEKYSYKGLFKEGLPTRINYKRLVYPN